MPARVEMNALEKNCIKVKSTFLISRYSLNLTAFLFSMKPYLHLKKKQNILSTYPIIAFA